MGKMAAVIVWMVILLVAPLLEATRVSVEPRLPSHHGSRLEGNDSTSTSVSALGDPGMRSDRVRVAVEGWNFCNRAGPLTSESDLGNESYGGVDRVTGSPRWADCTDLVCPGNQSEGSCTSLRKVLDPTNDLAPGDPFPEPGFTAYNDTDLYTREKELFLGSLCEVDDGDSPPWNFWMVMLKNGNFDPSFGLCPIASNSSSGSSSSEPSRVMEPFQLLSPSAAPQGSPSGAVKSALFPCFGPGCMNQPMVFLNVSQAQGTLGLAGGLYGTYDLDESDPLASSSSSFFSVNWYKTEIGGSWYFHHVLRVNGNYPWLMLYLRADATSGESGGYPWDTRGMMTQVPQSPNFIVQFTLNVLNGGGPNSQFYLLDIGGCWKNNGEQCDGDLETDVTRYSEMIINPDTSDGCQHSSLQSCPPFHTTANGTKIHRTDTANFPYSAYHYYCVPSNALYPEAPYSVCDSYSNPQNQELQQLLPHPEWAANGYPAYKGEGWIGDGRTWNLDTGALSSRLYFYQDPGTPPAIRKWPSVDIGTEILVAGEIYTAEWILSDFNVLVPSDSY